MANQTSDEPTDPITRLMKMAQAGETHNIPTSLFKEALEYSKELDSERARQALKGEEPEP